MKYILLFPLAFSFFTWAESGASDLERFHENVEHVQSYARKPASVLNPEMLNLAKKLEDQANHHQKNWNYGNALHFSRTLKGRLALKRGDVEEAKKWLLASSQIKGSPQLNSFGPDFILARELLENDMKNSEVVEKYFRNCLSFWEDSPKFPNAKKTSIELWIADMKKGKIPEFNLIYGEAKLPLNSTPDT